MAIFDGWRITRTGILFVIGILVLGGLVTTGLWMAKDRGEQARQDEAIQIAEEQLEDQSSNPVVIATEDQQDETRDDSEESVVATTNEAQEELPATGPEMNLLAIAALTIATSYFIASRRAPARG